VRTSEEPALSVLLPFDQSAAEQANYHISHDF